MNEESKTSLSRRCESFLRGHPLLLFAIVVITGFLVGPLMMAVGRMTAVLYKDF